MCCELLLAAYITLLALLVEHSLAHWYQQSVTVHRLQQKEFFYKLRSQRIYILEWLWLTDHLATTYGNIVLKFLYISLFKLIKRNGI